MKIVSTVVDLRDALRNSKSQSFVPTMGNLHAGHLSLIEQARMVGDCCVASIFVNPLQFGANEDFGSYPRTMDRDCELLEKKGCDLLFAPTIGDLYPEPQTFKLHPDPALADILEGEFRPGFFTGVATVVMKLFQCVFAHAAQPGHAFFGQKDFQQLLIVQRMVQQFALPITVHAVPTSRDFDGLALSSRNGYLSQEERREATALSQALELIRGAVLAGGGDLEGLCAKQIENLRTRGWQPDYLTVRRQADLQRPAQSDTDLVVLGAARLGRTRLIDNMLMNRGSA